MKIQLLRHATLLLEFGGKTLLVDPMLSEQAAMPPIINSANDRRNPLTPLTAPANYLEILDAVLLTHTHRDHFDDAAAQLLPKNKPVLCQPADEAKLKELGFAAVLPIDDALVWGGIQLKRTGGQHVQEKSAKKWRRFPAMYCQPRASRSCISPATPFIALMWKPHSTATSRT